MPRNRLLILLALVLGTLAVPAAANASFSARIDSPTRVGMTGTDDAESIAITRAGPFFAHDQTSPGFASSTDFDTATPGTQPVMDTGLRVVFTVDGEGGDDTIRLDAQPGSLQADGGDGADRIHGGGSHDRILGGTGDDFASGGALRDVIFLGSGDDRYAWTNEPHGNDDVDGGAGDDVLEASGTAAADKFRVEGFPTTTLLDVSGVTSPLRIPGVERLDLSLGAGADLLEQEAPPQDLRVEVDAGSGDDAIVGAPGPDLISGGPGVDEAHGGPGDDALFGEVVLGGGGNDRMTAELVGIDTVLRGEAGYDVTRLIAGSGTDALSMFRKSPFVTTAGSSGGQQVTARAGSEALLLEAGAGNDSITVGPTAGTESAIALDGGPGDDILRGSDGLEWLGGAAGEDVLEGGLAPDRLLGGGDADLVLARDRAADTVECGGGDDLVLADLGDLDRLVDASACETVGRTAATNATPLARVAEPRTLMLTGGTVSVPVTCSAGARGGCNGFVTLVSEPIAMSGMEAPAVLGRQAIALAPGTTAEIAVPVADRDDLARAAGDVRLDVQAQVLTGLAEHTTAMSLSLPE